MGLSNYQGAPPPPRRQDAEPLHSLEPDAELAAEWEKVRARVKATVPDFRWHIWLMHPQAVHRSGHTIHVEAPAHMFEMIATRYDGVLLLAAREVLGPEVTLEYVRHGWRPEGAPEERPAGQRMAEKLKNEPPPPREVRRDHGEQFTPEVEEAVLEGKMAAARKQREALACREHGWNAMNGQPCPRCRSLAEADREAVYQVTEKGTAYAEELTAEQAAKFAPEPKDLGPVVPAAPAPRPRGSRRRSDVPG